MSYPDRNGNLFPGIEGLGSLMGCQGFQIIEDPSMVKLKYHLEERKWSHRKRWKPEQRFNRIPFKVPSDQMMMFGQKIVAHPAMVKRLREAIEQQQHPNSFSMGMKVDASKFEGTFDYDLPSGFTAR